MNNPSDMKKILFLAALALMFGACCNNKTLTFMHLSDPQIGFLDTTAHYAQSDSLMGLAVEAVNRIKPACVVITGDLVNNTADEKQKEIFKRRLAEIDPTVPVFCLPGNHDERPYTSENHAAFLTFNGYDRFSFTKDGVAFIGFDSCPIKDGDVAAEQEQLDWLKAELTAAKDARQILLFTHCPVVRETLDETEDYFNFSLPKREEYLSLFKEYGVDALFAGHTHTCYNTEIDGIQFITAGPVGSPLHDGFSGLNVVKVGPEGITWRYTTAPEATTEF